MNNSSSLSIADLKYHNSSISPSIGDLAYWKKEDIKMYFVIVGNPVVDNFNNKLYKIDTLCLVPERSTKTRTPMGIDIIWWNQDPTIEDFQTIYLENHINKQQNNNNTTRRH